jgi:Lysine biosynthesis enzyme LysX
MRISLIVDIVRNEEKLLAEEIKKRAIGLEVLNVSQEPLELGRKVMDVEFAIIRTISMFRSLYSSAILEGQGIRTINNSKAINLCNDKILAYIELQKNDIKIPRTIIAFSQDSTLKAYKTIGFPLVDKPPIGSWGRLVSLIRDSIEGKAIIEHRELMNSSQLKVHIVQEYVNKVNRDIRCIVIGEDLLGCYARNSPKDDWRSNIALGGFPSKIEVDEELAKIAIKASKVLGVEFSGVDILEHEEKGYLVNEVNSTPEFKGFMSALNINVAEALVNYIIEKIKK